MRLLSAVHPTTNQKRVLAKILAAPTPTVAGAEISKDANLVAARNMLMKLGVISFANNEATLTDRGTQIAAEENISDQAGQLTPAGQQLAYTNSRDKPDSDQASGTQPQQSAPDTSLDMPTESMKLLKQFLR
jgi:hypothetical protein